MLQKEYSNVLTLYIIKYGKGSSLVNVLMKIFGS